MEELRGIIMNDCLFCKIVNGEIPSNKVFETESVLAIRDINPQAPVHVLIVPKKHLESLLNVGEADRDLVANIFSAIKEIAAKENVAQKGFRIAVNTGAEGGQLIKHLHFHLLGGRQMQGRLG